MHLALKAIYRKRPRTNKNLNSRCERSVSKEIKLSPQGAKKDPQHKREKVPLVFQGPIRREDLFGGPGKNSAVYLSQGFYHMRVISHEIEPLVGNNVRMVIRLEEGPPMMVSELDLKIDGPSAENGARRSLKFFPLRLEKDLPHPNIRTSKKLPGFIWPIVVIRRQRWICAPGWIKRRTLGGLGRD